MESPSAGCGSNAGSGPWISGSPATGPAADRACSRAGESSATSHSQQSLHCPHLWQRWLSQASLVHRTQIRLDSSPQILHAKGIRNHFFFGGLEVVTDGAVTRARHRCASLSITANSCSRALARLTM